ncbi:MAG TPA: hypothetical protein VGB19_04655 [Actinomycetota bacterium]
MLGSINPLGERARGSRWGVTVAALAVGAVAGGGAIGVVLGGAGHVLLGSVSPVARVAALAGALVAGAAFDGRLLGLRLPSIRRQVNEDWLGRYRGWVVGAAFGAQLGVGVVTVVTTSAVYAVLVAAVLTASPLAGFVVGATLGAGRALAVLPAGRATDPRAAAALGRRMHEWERPARIAGAAAQVSLAGALIVVAVT